MKPPASEVSTLSLPIKTAKKEDVLFLRLRDPAVPSRLWNQFAIRLFRVEQAFRQLVLTINFQDIVVTGGDRLWVDIGTAGSTEIKLDDKDAPAMVFVKTVPIAQALEQYVRKELVSSRARSPQNNTSSCHGNSPRRKFPLIIHTVMAGHLI